MSDTPVDALWSPVQIGPLDLPHRLVMAPMTRSRATPEGVPAPLAATYYRQRASNALIITEGLQPSADGQGYTLTPGIYTDEQIAGWRTVTDAVHEAGGRIAFQLMHAGRVGHPDNTPHHRPPVAPSAVRPEGQIFTPTGLQPMPEPRALTTEEVEQTVRDFADAAEAAVKAGADGVEIHGANGYLVQQFLSSNANLRTDRYGGSVENRIRFAVEVAEATAARIGAGRVGIHLSPGNPANDIVEEDVAELYTALVGRLAPLGLAYIHPVYAAAHDGLFQQLRSLWPGAYILNRPGAPIEARAADVASGLADAVSVGVMTLANPDLVARLKAGAPLNTPIPSAFFGGTEHGYTDYPAMGEGA